MPESRRVEELRTLAERIQRQIANWPEGMRSPKPGTDPRWDRVASVPRTRDKENDQQPKP